MSLENKLHTIKFGQEDTKFITEKQMLQIFNLDKIIQENIVAKNN